MSNFIITKYDRKERSEMEQNLRIHVVTVT